MTTRYTTLLGPAADALHAALALVAPGRPLRDGLDRVVRAKMGALVVIGDGPDVLIERALKALGQGDDAQRRRTLRQAFDRATLAAPLTHGAVFEGIHALLQALRPAWPMVVVTNKPSALARAVLDAGGLLPHFAAVYGADVAALRKPAPGMLNKAAKELGLAAHQLLMVGDSAADMGAAAAAGSPAAWAGWGYGVLHNLPSPPRWNARRPGQLLEILAERG
jgi:phosphoglycolate phosphatase